LATASVVHAGLEDCAQPVSTGDAPTASDALAVLRAAVGTTECKLCVCDVDASGSIAATDALIALKKAIQQPVALNCIACRSGCTNRVLQCGFHEWCCGEVGSPYEDAGSCGMIGDRQAEAGECFTIAQPDPFCVRCEDEQTACDSGSLGWNHGLNADPEIDGGVPFREAERCFAIEQDTSGNITKALCGVTCNPDSEAGDNGCPRLWSCNPGWFLCFRDEHCGAALACVGADPDATPPRPGRCACEESIECPAQRLESFEDNTPTYVSVQRPRCVVNEGGSYCLDNYNCAPPPFSVGYPATCTE
jgi:hypothetical protein